MSMGCERRRWHVGGYSPVSESPAGLGLAAAAVTDWIGALLGASVA